ncbi:unnamed protein product [Caenorhabditis auriculariae]|uniref:Uncharacterized protein n=1 Tax=Caenorhabditis auriculariae TaxID=2777116 RepID=A0A8S1HU42_9PELO|nr:unnamed protein product [Caenorhabditis auriculariae]
MSRGEDPLLLPPEPPSIPNNTQLDRKEKARIFMERLLNEKRLKKQQEEEEKRKVEEEAKKPKKSSEDEKKEPVKIGLSAIDDIINKLYPRGVGLQNRGEEEGRGERGGYREEETKETESVEVSERRTEEVVEKRAPKKVQNEVPL